MTRALPTGLAIYFAAVWGALLHPSAASCASSPPEVPSLEQAREALREGDARTAITLLEARRRTDAASFEELALLGGLYLEAGQAQRALEVLRPAADRRDAGPVILYRAALAALALEDAGLGESYLERAVQLAPASPAARQLGLRRGAAGDFAAAYELLGDWLAGQPEDLEASYGFLAAALALGHLDQVGDQIAALPVEREPRAAILLAEERRLRRDPWGVITVLEPWSLNPAPAMVPDLLRLLADAYLDVGRSADALSLLNGRVEGDARRALLLAEARSREGDLDGAVAALSPFLSTARSSTAPAQTSTIELLYDAGRHLLAAGDAALAAAVLTDASRLAPQEKLIWQGLATALGQIGDREGADRAHDHYRALAGAQAAADRRSGHQPQGFALEPDNRPPGNPSSSP